MDNLDLLLSALTGAGLAEARIIASPQGRSAAPASLSAFRTAAAIHTLPLADLQTYGSDLFNTLVADTNLRDLLVANLAAATARNAELRLRLQIDPPDLRRLPWEALYRDPTGFLALRDLSIARYIAVGVQINRPVVTQLPLKILVASASPSELPALNFAAERANLTEALTDEITKGWVKLEFVEHARRQTVRETLLAFRPHVFHFSGHGQFKEDRASLAFEDEYGDSVSISPDEAAVLFSELPDLRLIVLNACETALDSTAQPLTGIAPKLLQRAGVPAVVAMQAPILDRAAIAFSRAFYNQLAEGQSIDSAMREGRRAIYGAMASTAYFAVPVLFLSADEGQLIEFPEQIKERAAAQARQGFQAIATGPADELTTASLNRWQVNLTLATGLYRKLAAWKALHDRLHDLDEALECVSLEIPRLDKDDPDFSFIAVHWARCQTAARALLDFAQTGAGPITSQPFSETNGALSGEPWVVEVLIAQRGVDAALNAPTIKIVSGGVHRLRRGLQTHMNATDKQIQDLAGELGRLANPWTDPQNLPSNVALAGSMREMTRLHTLLFTAVEKQACFQDLENDFVRLRDEMLRGAERGFDWDALEAAWDFCRSDVLDSRFIPFARKIGELNVNGSAFSGSEWCVEVASLAANLDGLLSQQVKPAVRNTINRLGTAIRSHFFRTDKELKELTVTLDALADDLLEILSKK